MRMKILITIFLFLNTSQLHFAQCPGALTCEFAQLLCSADQLNHFTCINPSFTNTAFPYPNLCFGAGVAHNISWWAFVGSGSPMTMTFEFRPYNCELGQGIQVGVFEGDCKGNNIWDCNSSCNSSTFSLSGSTKACEIYFLWIDGCNKDVCPFNITVKGDGGPPIIQKPMPSLQISAEPCACGTINVCFPGYLGRCEPYYEWTIDGVPTGGPNDNCVDLVIPDTVLPGLSIEVCLTATIGNPSLPDGICNQDSTCTTITPKAREVHYGECQLVCFEERPVFWHGIPITSSCINPPCSVRTTTGIQGCCVDSIKQFLLLPPSNIGSRDTFICDANTPFRAVNDNVYRGEICDELIEFQREVSDSSCPDQVTMCDTSYYLTIGRFEYDLNWEVQCDSCEGVMSLCPNVTYSGECPLFQGQVDIVLTWIDSENGDTLEVTQGLDCIQVTEPGRYCLYVSGTYKDIQCESNGRECIVLNSIDFGQTPLILGDQYLCQTYLGSYEIENHSEVCEYLWSVHDNQGIILTPSSSDSSKIEVDWTGRTSNQATMCVEVLRDCGRRDTCWSVYFDTTETLATDTILLCPQDTIQLEEPVILSDRSWSNGETTSSIEVVGPGTFCVNGTPAEGSCELSKCFVITQRNLTISDTTITDDSGSGNGSITVMIETDDTIDQIEWNTGDTSLTISELMAGVYTLNVRTKSGCVYTFVFEVHLSTATKVVSYFDAWWIIPNPGVEFKMHPQSAVDKIQEIRVVNAQGLTVMTFDPKKGYPDFRDLSTGIYFIVIKGIDEKVTVKKWVKSPSK